MSEAITLPERSKTYPTVDEARVQPLRGDPMTGDRYYSRDFAQQEWDHMWKRVWHVAGRVADLEEPGDFIVHNFLRESVVVVMQEDGFVRLVDRIKEMIITGGFRVYPSQVEDHLRSMPGIEDVAIVGLPGGDLGERVQALLRLILARLRNPSGPPLTETIGTRLVVRGTVG